MSESETMAVIVIALILVVIFGSWVLAWRARRRSDAPWQAELAPAELSTPRAEHSVLVLATTRAEAPLERVAMQGLAVRSQSLLAVHDEGVVFHVPGRREPLFISRERLRGVGHANWALDRASGGDRIVVIRWFAGDADAGIEVDTAVRGRAPADIVADIQSLLAAPVTSGENE